MDSYTEISPSGKGVHIFVKGELPPKGRKHGDIEMYDSGRFFTVTGKHLKESPLTIENRESELKALHKKTFPPSVLNEPEPDIRVVQTSSSMTDAEIINKASQAANGSKFSRLWQGNWQSCYPSQSDYPSHSEADSALCFMLAFWTQDFSQIDRLFRQSKLMRDKWDSPRGDSTYGANCVRNAINHVGEIYQREADETAEGGSQGLGISHDQESNPQGEKRQRKADLIIANFNRTDLGNAERLVSRHGKGYTLLSYLGAVANLG